MEPHLSSRPPQHSPRRSKILFRPHNFTALPPPPPPEVSKDDFDITLPPPPAVRHGLHQVSPPPAGPLSTNLRILIRNRILFLEQELRSIKHLERAQSKAKQLSEEEKDLVSRKPVLSGCYDSLANFLDFPKKSFTNAIMFENHVHCLGTSQGKPLEKGRYLCFYYGLRICCLDLKRTRSKEYCSVIEPIPVESTLKLLEEGIPISMGLFKVHAETYMVGGQKFPWMENPPYIWDCNPFTLLYMGFGMKGSSLETHHLSFVSSRLSLVECDRIGPLNKAKVWPIVEKIGDRVHVIESLPPTFAKFAPSTIPTHEVLDLNCLDCGWDELPPLCNEEVSMHIGHHIVVGSRLFALPLHFSGFGVFDSEAFRWEWKVARLYALDSLLCIKHVAQIFRYGFGICTGQFVHDLGGYVVIAIGEYDEVDMIALAYLVSPGGQILCFQRLSHFFERFTHPIQGGKQGTIIRVDEDGERMCTMFEGLTMDTWEEFIYISTFTVKVVDGVGLLHEDLRPQRRNEDEFEILPPAIERSFVEVDVEAVYVYQREADPQRYDNRNWQPEMRACFL